MLERVIPQLMDGSLKEIKQKGQATFYRKFTPEDRKIDWTSSVFDIYNSVRASTSPYPGAFTVMNGEECSIWKAQVFDTKIRYENAEPGEIVEIFEGGDFIVNGVDGLLLIRDSEIKAEVGAIFD